MKANPVARDLRSPKYRMRVVEPGKGRGSYKRRDKHTKREEAENLFATRDTINTSTNEVHYDTSRSDLEE